MRVLIIDDEPNVRAGIKMIIPWEKEGFEIVGEGKDGIDGLEKILCLQPELVLIDIRMPGLNGLQVVEEARNKGFKGKIIITTGYSDFEYARKALRLKVNTYILKPIDEDELLENVRRLRDEIIEEEKRNKKLESSNHYIKTNLIAHLLMGNELSIQENEYLSNFSFEYEECYIGLLSVENNENIKGIIEELYERLEVYIEKDFIQVINDQIVVVLPDNDEGIRTFKKCHYRLKEKYGLAVIGALSSKVNEFIQIKVGFDEAKSLLRYAFLYPEVIFFENDMAKVPCQGRDEKYSDPKWMGQRLFNLIQVEDRVKIKIELECLKEALRRQSIERQRSASICSNTLLNIIQSVADKYSEIGIHIPSGEIVIDQIYSCNNIDEIIRYMMQEMSKILEKLKVCSPDNTMKKIIYYIENNYGSDLKLEYLAALFNYNSSYLGKSFKNFTGCSFNTYVDQIRINKAKEFLLKGDMKVYEIAQAVGYKHMDYFHSKFKKYVGTSPLEFKKNNNS